MTPPLPSPVSARPEPEGLDGLPLCSETCAQYDGKRCGIVGGRVTPGHICEPAVSEMSAALAALRSDLQRKTQALEAAVKETREDAARGCEFYAMGVETSANGEGLGVVGQSRAETARHLAKLIREMAVQDIIDAALNPTDKEQ